MNIRKSIFTSLLPILCIAGIIVLLLTWGMDEKNKNKIEITGPQNPPPMGK